MALTGTESSGAVDALDRRSGLVLVGEPRDRRRGHAGGRSGRARSRRLHDRQRSGDQPWHLSDRPRASADGTVDALDPWVDVPGWFSWENAGCGVAVTEGAAGGRDLVVFQIDNAVGLNQAFYRIGQALMPQDRPERIGSGGWACRAGSPGRTPVAASPSLRLGGARQLLAFMVDDPPGANAGLYEVLPLDPDPARDGAWELLPFLSGVLAVHTATAADGKVLFFAGSGSSAVRFDSPLSATRPRASSPAWSGTRPGNQFTHPATLRTANGHLRLLLRRRRVPARRPDALGRRDPGLQPVQGRATTSPSSTHTEYLVVRRPDGPRPLVPHADRSRPTAASSPPPG